MRLRAAPCAGHICMPRECKHLITSWSAENQRLWYAADGPVVVLCNARRTPVIYFGFFFRNVQVQVRQRCQSSSGKCSSRVAAMPIRDQLILLLLTTEGPG